MALEIARKYALQNAVLHGGKADANAVLGKILAEDVSLRSRARELRPEVDAVVADVNALSPESQRAELESLAPSLVAPKAGAVPAELPPLPNAVDGRVVVRLAPYPSGPLHIGNARAFVLNDEYAKRYHGRLLLVFDDTIGSEEKPILPEGYDLVRQGVDWAGITVHDVVYKTDRLPQHYAWSERLIETGAAYVDECSAEQLRKHREAGTACRHRTQEIDETHAMWRAMLDGGYGEGDAVLRLKTDVRHPNPAFRDRVLFRIAEREHPRVGTRYRVWPLLEFSWAVDDVLLGVTHVIRGKDLVIEDLMETAIWDALGVERRPVFVHFGILRFRDLELSKSKYRKEVEAGRLRGYDDPRTWSLQSLERRGFRPAALRSFVLSFGLSLTDVEVSAETLYAVNRSLVDGEANRYFLVPDPVKIDIRGLPAVGSVKAPLHPDFRGRGDRVLEAGPTVFIPRGDFEKHRGQEVRLKDFCNVVLDRASQFTSMQVKDVPKIQWLVHGVTTRVVMPDGSEVEGPAEPAVKALPVNTLVQFERFGFCRIDRLGHELHAWFTHR